MANKSSKAFDEFIAKRCEEILEGDKTHIKLNNEIMKLEEDLKTTMSDEQLKKYRQIENKIITLHAHEENLLYRKGFADRIEIK